MYNLVNEKLTIKESPIHGLGLFAHKGLSKGFNLGISHIPAPVTGVFSNDIIRTAMGGAINCDSENPNCELVKTIHDAFSPDSDKFTYWTLQTTKRIKEGEELTLNYAKYPCGVGQENLYCDEEEQKCGTDVK